MSIDDKLIAKFNKIPPSNDITIDEVKKVLSLYDYVEIKCKGSHHIFAKKDNIQDRLPDIPTTNGKFVKATYIKIIRKNVINGE